MTNTKSVVRRPRVYMSRIASPGEKVSLAVTIGKIFIPEPGLDHFESLEHQVLSHLDRSGDHILT